MSTHDFNRRIIGLAIIAIVAIAARVVINPDMKGGNCFAGR